MPGDTSIPLCEALYDAQPSVRHVMARDERSASFMADAYARLSHKPGLCECPSGAGPLYSVSGIARGQGVLRARHPHHFRYSFTGEGKQTITELDTQKVAIAADAGLIDDFIDTGKALVAQGVKAVTTSCGFLGLFHRQLVDALPVPVFTSSLLQVHLTQSVIRSDQKIGIITVHRVSLTDAHLAGVGIQDYPLAIVGPAKGLVCQLDKMLDEYYQVQDWTNNGIPSKNVLDRLGLA